MFLKNARKNNVVKDFQITSNVEFGFGFCNCHQKCQD